MQLRLMAAGKNKQALAFRLPVNNGLQVGKQMRCPLDFIKNGPVGELSLKAARIGCRKQSRVGIFKRAVGLFFKNHPGKRRFTRLPRPHNRYDRILCRYGLQLV